MNIDELQRTAESIKAVGPIPVTFLDREAFAVALVIQGYSPAKAHAMAIGAAWSPPELPDHDGALQMLARRRIATEATRGCMDDRELGAVLAGLRALQNVQQHEPLAPEIMDVMTNGGTHDPLDDEEIDALCERLNTADQ